MRPARPVTAALLAAAATACASCSVEATPTYRLTGADDTVTIQVSDADPQARLLAEVYLRALGRADVRAEIETVDPGSERGRAGSLAWLADGGADLVIGCTGQLLADAAPGLAAGVGDGGSGEDGAGDGGAEAAQATYDALAGVLPGDYDMPDPSPAQGCGADAEGGAASASGREQQGAARAEQLPQNIVPVYRKSEVNRWGKLQLNYLTRLLTTHDLEEMTERVADGEKPGRVIFEWLGSSNPDMLD